MIKPLSAHTLCQSQGSEDTYSHVSNMIWVGCVEIFYRILSPVTEPQVLTNEGHILDEVEQETPGDETPAHRPQILKIH